MITFSVENTSFHTSIMPQCAGQGDASEADSIDPEANKFPPGTSSNGSSSHLVCPQDLC